jgi:hypothetical protein
VARLLGVAVLIVGALVAGGCGATGDQSDAIAANIGASTCHAEQYEIVSRISGHKDRIYNCTLHGKTICVTYSGGIASNATAEVKLLFANALGGQKPDCMNG